MRRVFGPAGIIHDSIPVSQERDLTDELKDNVLIISSHDCVLAVGAILYVIGPTIELISCAENEGACQNALESVSLFRLHGARQFDLYLHHFFRVALSGVDVVSNESVRAEPDLRIL